MNSTEDTILRVIWDFGGEASISTIAKAARITPDYARLLCVDLGKHDYIDFINSRSCCLRPKGRAEAARMKVGDIEKRRKIVVGDAHSKANADGNKEERFVLGY